MSTTCARVLMSSTMTTNTKRFKKVNDVVYSSDRTVELISRNDVSYLCCVANNTPEKKSRILLHGVIDKLLHEMIIVHRYGTYIRPHINDRSEKSFVIIKGEMVVVLYDKHGSITEKYLLSTERDDSNLIIRLNEPIFHTIVVMSEETVFLESTLGPHTSTRYADFAPGVEEKDECQHYLSWLQAEVGNVQ